MTFREYTKEIKRIVLLGRQSHVCYAKEDDEHIKKMINKGYFIDHMCHGERVMLFTRKLISDIKGGG